MVVSRITVISSVVLLIGLGSSLASPPPATKRQMVVDTIHGVVVEDPYRWLEDGEDPAVIEWTEQQHDYFESYVDGYPGRQQVYEGINRLYAIGSVAAPLVAGSLYVWEERHPGEDQPVLYKAYGAFGEPAVLLDPNSFSEDGTTALDWHYLSDNGALLVYGKSSSGSELSTLYVLRTEDGTLEPDTIPFTRAASVAWLNDYSGFYYTRFGLPGSSEENNESYYRRVYLHRLGTDWENDSLIFGGNLSKEAWTNVELSPDGTKLFCSASFGYVRTEYYYQNLSDPADTLKRITPDQDAIFSIVPRDDRFYVHTNLSAPRWRVLRGDYDAPGFDAWTEIIPETDRVIENVGFVAGQLAVQVQENAYTRLLLYSPEGEFERETSVEGIGSTSAAYGDADGTEIFYQFTSYNVPRKIFRYVVASARTGLWKETTVDIDLSDVTVDQVWYPSKDGTQISMFIVRPASLETDGTCPTVLYGYGGFSVSMTPSFSKRIAYWTSLGGIFAIANLRGGGEYGEEWHHAGMLDKRQNVYDDFISAAEYLVAEKYTSREKLAIMGGSNGGLLVGAVMTQRPDLCQAVVCQVPLLDMVRYHKFGIARLWIPEYGSADNPDQFPFLLTGSPYHQVTPNRDYPATLLTAAASDSRVDPLHARKMAAALQAASSSDAPILLRIETKAGHGQGKPVSKWVQELADEICFLCRTLGVTVK